MSVIEIPAKLQKEFDSQLVYDQKFTVTLTHPDGKQSDYPRFYTYKHCLCGCNQRLIPKLVSVTGYGRGRKNRNDTQPEGNHSFAKRRYVNTNHANKARGKIVVARKTEPDIFQDWLCGKA